MEREKGEAKNFGAFTCSFCFSKIKSPPIASKSLKVGRIIKQLHKATPDILRKYLVHLQGHMITIITARTSARNIHIMIEFLLIILDDVPKDVIRHEKISALLARVVTLTKEVFILVQDLEDNSRNEEKTKGTSCGSLDLLESIKLLKEDLKHVFLKAPNDSSQLYFPKSDGPLFMALLLVHLKDLLDSDACSVALIKEEVVQLKEGLEFIRSFFGKVERESSGNLWTRVLDVAYEAECSINSILVRDNSLIQLIFLLPNIVRKIRFLREEVQENISKSRGQIVPNFPNKPVKGKSSTKQIVGFQEEAELIIGQLTRGTTGLDVISIVGMAGSGKTTLTYKVYNDVSVTSYFDIRIWSTIDQKYNMREVLKNIYDQVAGLEDEFNEDFDINDELRRKLYGKRCLIVLDDLWDTKAWDELIMPFQDLGKGSRIILTSREKQVASHAKCHSDPLSLRLLTQDESWELLKRKIFGGSHCPNELLRVGKEIANKCKGLPLVLDLIGGVIAREAKNKSFWLEVVQDLSSFVVKDDQEVMKVVQLSYEHLSDHLKPCLLYFSTFPKDTGLKISHFEDLWRGEGLVELMQMNSAEEDYVDGLISSNLLIVFQETWDDEPRYKIHDLVHDFCSIKVEKEKLFERSTSDGVAMPPAMMISCLDRFFYEKRKNPYFEQLMKEKLFKRSASSSAPSSSSSSDVIPRAMILEHMRHLPHAFFNAEKKNPYAKHLLSFGASWRASLPKDCQLRHLRLLRSLELRGRRLTDSLINEIGMLFHLRYLEITTEAETLHLSFSNLWNLETLIVHNSRSSMVLSPTIWSLTKLRVVRINYCSLFDWDKPVVLEEDWNLENLTKLENLHLTCWDNTNDVFKRFPNLGSLKFKIVRAEGDDSDDSDSENCFPLLDVLNKLERVEASASYTLQHKWESYFPSSLKELILIKFDVTSDSLSEMASQLPKLQKLCLRCTKIDEGKGWDMTIGGVTFPNLNTLTLDDVFFFEWKVDDAGESFPLLQKLIIRGCEVFKVIPASFGDVTSLQFIKLIESPQLKRSALRIKEYVKDLNGEDMLDIIIV